MRKKIIYISTVFALSFALSASIFAQGGNMADAADLKSMTENNSLGVKPVANPFALLDLSRIKWSHSYSVNFFSGGLGSSSVGMYNTNMYYDISKSLSLSLNLGIAHDIGGSFNSISENRSSSFLPGFNLDFHPSENFRMSINYQKYQGYGYPIYDRGFGSGYLR